MFTYLKVKNFALIDDVEIEFKQGFTAFVGETGAGKSLLVDAINLLSGARSTSAFVKEGTSWALIQGSFFLPPNHAVFQALVEHDIFVGADEEMLVERKIMNDGRTTCKVQGIKVPTAFLKRIMHELIDIHGQHETSTLLQVKHYLKFLDRFGQYQSLLLQYQSAYNIGCEIQEEKAKIEKLYRETEAIPEYEKQIAELMQANVTPEEIAEIDQRLAALKAFNHHFANMTEIVQVFEHNQLLEHLYKIKEYYESFAQGSEACQRLTSAYYDLQDIKDDITHQVNHAYEQKQEQEKLEARVSEIFTLQKKFGDDLQAAVVRLQDSLDKLQNIEFEYAQVEKRLVEQKETILALGKRLHEARRRSAQKLEEAIMQQLAALHMERVEFKIEFATQEASLSGFDAVEFYVKTNVGTEFQPLARIASGGELSRIMLAIKIVFAKTQTLSAIIFDEIDTGVSGVVAEAIAKKLRLFSTTQQVFAITHLPQVLAASNHQLLIEKSIVKDHTQIKVSYLDAVQHQMEVAKMLSGSAITDAGKKHAADLTQVFDEM